MKKLLRLFSLALVLLVPLGFSRAAEGDAALRFGEDGSFTVMLLSDTQDTQYPPAYLIRSIEGALNNYDVDLVVLLGDQLEGESPVLRLGNDRENIGKAISYILNPIRDAGVPFALVFGNHDYDAPVPPVQQLPYYRLYENCLTPELDAGQAYCLPVYPTAGDTAALMLYFFDSGPDTAAGSYGAVSAEQIAWYRETSNAHYDKNSNQTTPAVAFQHVPVMEIYELFDEAPVGERGALNKDGRSYVANASKMLIGEALEAPCPSDENYGLFDAFVEQGDVFLAVSGHDHVNSFIGSVQGVDLCAAPGSSYTSYGDAAVRGVRLLRFYEDNVKSYNTIHVRYTDFIQTDGISAVRYYLSTTTAIPNAVKTLILFLMMIALIVLFICLLHHSRRHPKPVVQEADSGYDDAPDEKEP